MAATLGAVGKWAIHPSQIDIANDVFAPTVKEIDSRPPDVRGLRGRGRRRAMARRVPKEC